MIESLKDKKIYYQLSKSTNRNASLVKHSVKTFNLLAKKMLF